MVAHSGGATFPDISHSVWGVIGAMGNFLTCVTEALRQHQSSFTEVPNGPFQKHAALCFHLVVSFGERVRQAAAVYATVNASCKFIFSRLLLILNGCRLLARSLRAAELSAKHFTTFSMLQKKIVGRMCWVSSCNNTLTAFLWQLWTGADLSSCQIGFIIKHTIVNLSMNMLLQCETWKCEVN